MTRGLSEAIHLYGLRCDDFLAIIDGMEMKARRDIRAPSFAALDGYCERVAVAVGRISVRIFGEASPAGERVAEELGRALRLTNILRDLAEDAQRHRLYLPRELLHALGIFATTPTWVLAQPALPDVCRDLAMLAEQHYAAAAEAIAACPRWTMREAAVMLVIYHALLHELRARGWRQLDEPIRTPAWRKARTMRTAQIKQSTRLHTTAVNQTLPSRIGLDLVYNHSNSGARQSSNLDPQLVRSAELGIPSGEALYASRISWWRSGPFAWRGRMAVRRPPWRPAARPARAAFPSSMSSSTAACIC